MNRELNKKALQRLTGKTLLDAQFMERLSQYKHSTSEYHIRAKELEVCKRQKRHVTYRIFDVQIWLEKCREWPGPIIYDLKNGRLLQKSVSLCPLCRDNIILYARNLRLFKS